MGVEQVLVDAFTRAKDYQKEWKKYNDTKDKKGINAPRRDLELDALVEILEKKRRIDSILRGYFRFSPERRLCG